MNDREDVWETEPGEWNRHIKHQKKWNKKRLDMKKKRGKLETKPAPPFIVAPHYRRSRPVTSLASRPFAFDWLAKLWVSSAAFPADFFVFCRVPNSVARTSFKNGSPMSGTRRNFPSRNVLYEPVGGRLEASPSGSTGPNHFKDVTEFLHDASQRCIRRGPAPPPASRANRPNRRRFSRGKPRRKPQRPLRRLRWRTKGRASAPSAVRARTLRSIAASILCPIWRCTNQVHRLLWQPKRLPPSCHDNSSWWPVNPPSNSSPSADLMALCPVLCSIWFPPSFRLGPLR